MIKRFLGVVVATIILVLLSITAAAQQVFVANLSSAQEVPTNATTGTGVATVTLNAAETQINIVVTYSGLSSAANMGHIHGPAPVGVNAGVQIAFAGVTGTSNTLTINNQAITPTQIQQIRTGQAYVNIHTINNSGGEIRGQLKIANQFGDFDGDGRFDIGVYRPGNTTFYILNTINSSVTAQQWGLVTDGIGLADFDGDGKSDFTAVRDVSGSLIWYILQSSNGALRAVQWGGGGFDEPVPGDYDGDGKADLSVFRHSNGTFYVLRSSDGGFTSQQWGAFGDENVQGDFDKDGKIDFAVRRTVDDKYNWYILQSSNGAFLAIQWGATGDDSTSALVRPDFDLDGRTDIVVWRPSNGTYYTRLSSDGSLLAFQFGQAGDVSGAVDVDGDGKADFGAIRNVGGNLIWYVWLSSTNTLRSVQWGISGDEPV